MDAMFFDMRRYDISAVGRYKYNKKLNIARRITGHKLVNAVADPMTGEVLADAGEILSREKEIKNYVKMKKNEILLVLLVGISIIVSCTNELDEMVGNQICKTVLVSP